MGALSQQLDSYSRLGIPKLQHCKVKFEAEDAVEEGMCKTKYLNPNYAKTIRLQCIQINIRLFNENLFSPISIILAQTRKLI